MTGHDRANLAFLLQRLQVQLAEPVDFTQAGPVATAAKVRLLSAAAFQTYRGEDPHPTPFDKAAMLLRGIIQGHPYTDANKRTGFLVTAFDLDRASNVLQSRLSTAEVVSFCRRVSAGEVRDLRTIAVALQAWTEPHLESPQTR